MAGSIDATTGAPIDAKTEADNIGEAQDNGVTTAAADAYKADAEATTPDGQKYWTDVANNLQASGDLPTVNITEQPGFSSLSTAEAQRGYIAGKIDDATLSPIDKASYQQVSKDFNYLDAASEGDGINAQSFENVDKLRDDKHEQQSHVAMFTGSSDGKVENSLLGRVDKDAAGRGGDMSITQDDIKEALEAQPDRYSEAETRYLNDLAAQSKEDWEKNPLVQKGDDDRYRITKESLLHANDYAGLATKENELGGKTGDEGFQELVNLTKHGAHFTGEDQEHPSYVITSDGTRRDFQYDENKNVVGVTEYKKNFEDGRASEHTRQFSQNEQGQWGYQNENGDFVADGTSGHSVDKDGNYQVFQDISGDPAMEGKPAEEAHILRKFDGKTGQEQIVTGVQAYTPPAEGEQK